MDIEMEIYRSAKIIVCMDGMLSQNKEIYAREASAYASQKNIRADEEKISKCFKGEKILVLGCGAGRTIQLLLDKGYDVTAIDIIPEMVALAQEQYKNTSAKILCMDAAHLDFEDGSFETVFFPFHGIDYVYPDIYSCVVEVQRVLTQKGVFVFSSHNRLYLKKLHRFFVGTHDSYHGLQTYRTSPLDVKKLKIYFEEVIAVQRISLVPAANWKDCLYQFFPWLSKSTYFVCNSPKK